MPLPTTPLVEVLSTEDHPMSANSCAQVEILSEGDNVNELMMLVGGMVEVLRPGAEDAEELTIDVDGHSSIRGGSYNRSTSFFVYI